MFAALTPSSKKPSPVETFREGRLLTSASPLGCATQEQNTPLSPYWDNIPAAGTDSSSAATMAADAAATPAADSTATMSLMGSPISSAMIPLLLAAENGTPEATADAATQVAAPVNGYHVLKPAGTFEIGGAVVNATNPADALALGSDHPWGYTVVYSLPKEGLPSDLPKGEGQGEGDPCASPSIGWMADSVGQRRLSALGRCGREKHMRG